MNTAQHALAALAVTATTVSGIGITTATAQTTAPVAATGVRTSADIPWKSVGTAWSAHTVLKGGKNHLVLVSPGGQSYEITVLARNEFVSDIANTGRYVVTTRSTDTGRLTNARVWVLKTGRVSATLPADLRLPTFTSPKGTAVMGLRADGAYERYSLTGVKQARRTGAANVTEILPNPNGLTDVVNADTRIQLRNHSNFAVLRTYALPAGSSACRVRSWLDASTLIETCTVKPGVRQVFSQNARGGAPKALTTGNHPGSYTFAGFQDFYRTSIGNLAMASENAAPYLPKELYRLTGTKATSAVGNKSINPNGGNYSGGMVTGMIGDRMTYESFPYGDDSTGKMAAYYDVRTKKTTYLVGNNSQYGGAPTSSAFVDPLR